MKVDEEGIAMKTEAGHDWKLVEAGPEGIPSWGAWWECARCGEGTRRVAMPSKDHRVYDGMFTCEEKRAHAARTGEG
jgi:hypothetical protein